MNINIEDVKRGIKEGFQLNPDPNVVVAIIRALNRTGGTCPCSNTSEDKRCPCSNYRLKNKCCCDLYVEVL